MPQDHRVADADAQAGGLVRRRRPHVDKQRLQRNRLVPLFALEDMRRLAPDHAPHLAAVAGADHDRLRRQDPRVPPAQGREMEKSPLVDIIDDQTDLIEVRIQHHGKPRPAPPRDQEVPEYVGADLVGVRLHQRPQRLPGLVFKTGHPKRIRQRLQQPQRLHPPSLLSPREMPRPFRGDPDSPACRVLFSWSPARPCCSDLVPPRGGRYTDPMAVESSTRCPQCGTSNPPQAQFCMQCGTLLQGTGAAERRVVTVLFADLVGSTQLTKQLDPEPMRTLIARFFAAMREEIARYGGTIEKFIGDAVMAVFGMPAAHEDDPERALRAALAMQRRMVSLNADLEPDLHLRTDIAQVQIRGELAAAADRKLLVTR